MCTVGTSPIAGGGSVGSGPTLAEAGSSGPPAQPAMTADAASSMSARIVAPARALEAVRVTGTGAAPVAADRRDGAPVRASEVVTMTLQR
jgi:hypothetical protein